MISGVRQTPWQYARVAYLLAVVDEYYIGVTTSLTGYRRVTLLIVKSHTRSRRTVCH